MPTIFIDDKPYSIKEGQNLLHAALSHGLDIPYFCWHPGLGSVGACRQCAMQHFKDADDKDGRMIMSCMTPGTEGMRVSIAHETARSFRADISEWMMTNHPHDCPVCDEGGECHLQDMTVMTGHNYRKFRFKKRTFNNQKMGPFVNHEMNRCITCYRCVRYYRDLAGGTDLNSFASSNRVYFGRDEDGTLENEFSGNLVEVCPTGVFTDKPFKAFFNRKWDLQMAPSVCQLCSLGCNIIPGERFESIRRVQNRYNHEINDYFLCDKGRFGHSFVNSKERFLISTWRQKEKDVPGEINQEEAFQRATKLLSSSKKTIGIGSPRASLEANFALRTLVGEDNFYDGLSRYDSVLLTKVKKIVKEGLALTASLQNVKEADAILVLGEDLINTAPRLALAIRQNNIHMAQKKAGAAGIATWNDLAVRNFVREKVDTIFLVTVSKSKLEDVANSLQLHPDNIACLGYAIAHELNSDIPLPKRMDADLLAQARLIADVLRQAKNPVIISGTSLYTEAILDASANVAWALCQQGSAARICYALPEANSMGLSLLNAKPLSLLVDELDSKERKVDVAIVLENDLSRRLPSEKMNKFFQNISSVIALDSFQQSTMRQARLAVASCSFAEGSGTFVNNEGRVQRFYGVFERKEKVLESWRILRDWIKKTQKKINLWKNLDEITDHMCQGVNILAAFDRSVYRANFQIDGQKIPRETNGYSGRTAIVSNVTMHEPKPLVDIDSPLAHSMEGFAGQPPSTLIPFFWEPGWNSVQSVNKYQKEIGGELKSQQEAIRLFDGTKDKVLLFFKEVPVMFEQQADQWQVFPRYFIFGSEEHAAMSEAISQNLSKPCIAVSHEDAKKQKFLPGSLVNVEINDQEWKLPLVIYPELQSGMALMAHGLPGMKYAELPSYACIRLSESAT
jgi:NADH-quinone oxidoreductase subunit G